MFGSRGTAPRRYREPLVQRMSVHQLTFQLALVYLPVVLSVKRRLRVSLVAIVEGSGSPCRVTREPEPLVERSQRFTDGRDVAGDQKLTVESVSLRAGDHYKDGDGKPEAGHLDNG